jgi:hypothetical protein
MIRRSACILVLTLAAAVAACGSHAVVAGGGAGPLPSQAAALGEFLDNPQIAFVPADTPYAFASFRAFPIDLVRKMTAVAGPVWRRTFLTHQAQTSDSEAQRRMVKDLLDALDALDVKSFEAHGFSAKARFVAYGLGPYPVFRAELSNGDRVFELARGTAERWNEKLPAPTERAGRRYWIVELPDLAVFVAIAPKELVMSLAPRHLIDANLAALLGEQRPARSMTTAQFRALAERDGFTGQGVGFVDLARVGDLIAAGAAPDCRTAVAAIARRAPRLAMGYEDLTLHRLAFGMVLELAPEILADARRLSGSLAGVDRLLEQKPAMAVAVAGDVEHGRALLGRVAGVLQDLGQRCELSGLAETAAELATAAGHPLPPFLAGLRGGFLVLTNLKMGAHDPESIEGFGSLQLDHTGELLQLAGSQLPGFDMKPDGQAHALPALIPYPGHVAASDHAIGLGLGPSSAATAVGALQGKPMPAPLALFVFDYRRMGDLILSSQHGSDADNLRDLIKAFGVATMQLLVDARGVVASMAFELR